MVQRARGGAVQGGRPSGVARRAIKGNTKQFVPTSHVAPEMELMRTFSNAGSALGRDARLSTVFEDGKRVPDLGILVSYDTHSTPMWKGLLQHLSPVRLYHPTGR